MKRHDNDELLDLKTARRLVNDVAKETEDAVRFQRLALEQDRFREGLKVAWRTRSQRARMEADLRRAIELARRASVVEPGLSSDEDIRWKEVMATAYYQRGLIAFRSGNWSFGQQSFEESYSIFPTQDALFSAALCRLADRRRLELSALLNPWQLLFGPFVLVKACLLRPLMGRGWTTSGRYTTDEIVAAFRRVIDANPESRLATEAGKLIVRLPRR